MEKEKQMNCWEYEGNHCSGEKRENCPAFQTDSGRECWLVASHYCCKRIVNVKYCFECDWFKKINHKEN